MKAYFYMKSGNVIVIDHVKSCTVKYKNDTTEFTGYEIKYRRNYWKFWTKAYYYTPLVQIDVAQIEGVVLKCRQSMSSQPWMLF